MTKPTRREWQTVDRFYASLADKPAGEFTAQLAIKAPIKRAKRKNTEAREQIAVCDWWSHYSRTKNIDPRCLFSIPNGSGMSGGYSKNMIRMIFLKKMGLQPGVPDLMLAVPRAPYCGCFIEMKSLTGGVRPEQIDYRDLLRAMGYAAHVCYGAAEAIETIKGYLG